MGEKIVIGPINRGLKNDRTAFVIDNDSFPTLINAYQWRGRVKRKRGTSLLNRLARFFNSLSSSYNPTYLTTGTIAFGTGMSAGQLNLITGFTTLQSNASIVPSSVTITSSSGVVYTDPLMNGNLTPSTGSNTGTINYSTGLITIVAEAGNTASATFSYYPTLPVMGLEDLVVGSNPYAGSLAFDTVYSYNMKTSSPYQIYDVSFYKNPSAGLTGYVPKSVWTPTTWNGQDYQQTWTTNYQGALWATNGINVPFNISNIGMQYKPIVAVTVTSGGPPAIVNLQITGHGLVQGDFLFINEVSTTTGINLQTGYVTTVVNANNVTVEFPNATIATNGTGGIAQYLTNRSSTTVDCLRWYDGDPTNGNTTSPTFVQGNGWVNFAPPLSSAPFIIGDTPAAIYYLVGARMILPFKDRLVFFGPVIQSSSAGSQIYLQDTVIYSQNGTPYYTCSFTGSATSASTTFNPILCPTNQTATPNAYWEDQTGFGGYITAGIDQPILTASANEDVLIVGFNNLQTRLVYSGNDIVPFNFFVINSELGSSSTFSIINMDKGVFTRGGRGFIVTSQIESKRIDLDIPDQVFQLNLTNNGAARVCAQRDYINEWIYFTYPSNQVTYNYPNQTLQYNYRDDSWAILNECYTTYGQFRRQTGQTWATLDVLTWTAWNEPWNSGTSTLLQPEVIAGNPQGFVMIRDVGTQEGNSLSIENISFPVTITNVTQALSAVVTANNTFVIGQQVTISGVAGMTQLNGNTYTITAVTPTTFTLNVNSTTFTAYVSGGTATPVETVYSPNHCLNEGDYIVIYNAIGTISSQVNGKIFSVGDTTVNGFQLSPNITSGTYLGLGTITRMYVPQIQTKQFPVAWGTGRKTRIGPQQYLFTRTPNGQVTLLIFLSQNDEYPYNLGPIVPSIESLNNSLIYATTLYTCPESTNLGLTAGNINLNMLTGAQQEQIWHRMNTSLLGDTVQIGFTLLDPLMRDTTFSNQFAEIEFHSAILDVTPSMMLS